MQRAARALCLAAVIEKPLTSEALFGSLGATLGSEVEALRPDGALLAKLGQIYCPAPHRLYEALLALELQTAGGEWSVTEGLERRRGGSHFTPTLLAEELARRCLAPLLRDVDDEAQLLDMRICDPAVGAGAFLLAARNLLTHKLLELRARTGKPPSLTDAAGAVTEQCLYGVDIDPIALWLARRTLCEESDTRSTRTHRELQEHLLLGDALIDPVLAERSALSIPAHGVALALERVLPEVFGRERPGFDAVLGNPPWVAFVGRAAQPLPDDQRRFFAQHYQSFKRYRTLHGLFVERAATLLREGGRLGLLLPTSVVDLNGYAPTRDAHDALCLVDGELPDYGADAFDEVFQPCVGLLSTRTHGLSIRTPGASTTQTAEVSTPVPRHWELGRSDLDPLARRIVNKLKALPTCPPELFRERGYQTNARDRDKLKPANSADSRANGEQPLFTGSEVLEFRTLPARFLVDPRSLTQRFRDDADWQSVALWIRQTARYPIAALANGNAFRNSIIAGFETSAYPRFLLLAYLNSTPIRWFHYHSHRDARQGMPQVKVGHLRALPAPPGNSTPEGQRLEALGRALATSKDGIRPEERTELDAVVAAALGLDREEVHATALWGTSNPLPQSRSLKASERATPKPPPSLDT